MRKSSILIALGIGCLLIWFIAARWIYRGVMGAGEKEAKAEMVADCGCSSIDDCLVKNKIDCAWEMYANNEWGDTREKLKIIKAESINFIEVGEYKKGWNNLCGKDLGYSESDLIAYKYEYLNMVIDELIEEGDLKKAKLYAMKASDEHDTEGSQESGFSEWYPNKTQRQLLLKKVKEFE